MKFSGLIEVGGQRRPIELEIGTPRPSTKAPYECAVSTTYPRALTTTLFGVTEEGARASALTFIKGLVGEAQLLTTGGAPVDLLSASAPASRSHGPTRAPIGAGGLALSILPIGEDKIRLVVEEVRRTESGWALEALSTHNDYDREKLTAMGLSAEQFGEIGFNVVLSLLARAGLLAPRPGGGGGTSSE